MPDVQAPDVTALRTRVLLSLYADILTELLRRGVVRSRNAPAGDLAESLVAAAYGGALAAPSEKSWDVRADDGRLLQVKCRVLERSDRRAHSYSPFRSWGFDACVFVLLDAASYAVTSAVEVPMARVRASAREVAWVRGHRLHVRQNLAVLPGARDVTAELQAALDELDAATVPRSPAPQASAGEGGASRELPVKTGTCLCGCGQQTSPQASFVSSHDRIAESRVIREHYGSVAAFVQAHAGLDSPPVSDRGVANARMWRTKTNGSGSPR
jgi:hypothetical protein